MSEKRIANLLKKKHKDDIGVYQCKNGPSRRGYSIFDYWAMKKSWKKQFGSGEKEF